MCAASAARCDDFCLSSMIALRVEAWAHDPCAKKLKMRVRHLHFLAKLDRALATDFASSRSTLSHQASRHSSLKWISFKSPSGSALSLRVHLLELLHQAEDLFVLPRDPDTGVPRGIRFGVIYLLQVKVEVTEPFFCCLPPLRYVCKAIITLERSS